MNPGTAEEKREITIVWFKRGPLTVERCEHRVSVPRSADFCDLLEAVRTSSPDLYDALRARALQAAVRVLSRGEEDDLLPRLQELIDRGQPLVFSAEDDEELLLPAVNGA